MKSKFLFVLVCVLMICFVGFAAKEKMVCTYAQMANDFFLTFDKGAKEAVEALGNVYVAATDDRRPEKFLSQIESFSSAGVKMIFGYSPTIGSVIQASNIVNREQVYYANILEIADWWTPLDAGPYYGQFIGPDAYVDGYLGGLEMGRFLGGEGETCVLWGFRDQKQEMTELEVIKLHSWIITRTSPSSQKNMAIL